MINDLQKDKLQIILNDEILLSAIGAVFFETIEKFKPQINETDNNELLGEKYRAYELSKKIMEQSSIDLQSYRKDKKTDKPFNKAR